MDSFLKHAFWVWAIVSVIYYLALIGGWIAYVGIANSGVAIVLGLFDFATARGWIILVFYWPIILGVLLGVVGFVYAIVTAPRWPR